METLRRFRWIAAAVAVVLVLVVVVLVRGSGGGPDELTLGELEQRLADGEVTAATVRSRSDRVVGELADGTEFTADYPAEFEADLTRALLDADVSLETDTQTDPLWMRLLLSFVPVLLIVGILIYLVVSLQGRGRFGKAKARRARKDRATVTFADVAGADEAVRDLEEIKQFLSEPDRFHQMGAKIPKGVLLYGPPGTGKTLLARAVAGEAGVPFFSISGSDFVEMFVGVGASRVRDLFDQAKAEAPAIIFVDEIDAVGRHRGSGTGGGHDEREQTLNQLLVEMDGFDVTKGIILIAATNRPDILDPALLRPGRFDRQIVVDQPDLDGRRAILDVHCKGKPLGPDVDTTVIARRTPGFTGADLANLINEAALLAVRRDKDLIGMAEVEDSVDRVVAGAERSSRVMSLREKRVIAYHEGGHALVGHVLPNTDPIHKVSIVARGRALGWTLALPAEDTYLQSRSQLVDQMAMLLGGRTAEEIVFGDPTTGAADDIERCTTIARAMVEQYGMSEVLGPRRIGDTQREVQLGRDGGHPAEHSDELAALINAEVRRLIDEAHAEARGILMRHRDTLDHLADQLVEHETLDDVALREVFAGITPGPVDEMPR
ncbi:ATP-dependent zinc metalloprotease FtsH [Actinomarinicola tropica]|uniref:ATP-dependent zinc metalloprotease FtsH n=1 Tax=Actinomarinicola tropica TaxID=2789776 RepID=A0A5Q2RNI0_9ACTN|nr:ATP-dependent zinc metalloprotease FtsH [Actinomarinicola tropica]QGG96502.1 ATP-dependent zinc metalloprotease FtsH [Actinomarinicola tropica]